MLVTKVVIIRSKGNPFLSKTRIESLVTILYFFRLYKTVLLTKFSFDRFLIIFLETCNEYPLSKALFFFKETTPVKGLIGGFDNSLFFFSAILTMFLYRLFFST